MAFTLEDGTGVADANAYISVDEFDDHHTDRGVDLSSFDTLNKQSGIIKATDYVDKRFGAKFRGFRETKAQALEWPRLSAFDNDDFLYSDVDRIPRRLKKAIAEYALIAMQIALLPLPSRPFSELDPATGEVTAAKAGPTQRIKEKVGPIEEETWYHNINSVMSRTKPFAGSSSIVSDYNLPEYPVADEWLNELLQSGLPSLSRA